MAVESYCGHLPIGKSYFCDIVWRLWDVNFVQTIFWTSTFFFYTAIGALFIGFFEKKKKDAFELAEDNAIAQIYTG